MNDGRNDDTRAELRAHIDAHVEANVRAGLARRRVADNRCGAGTFMTALASHSESWSW